MKKFLCPVFLFSVSVWANLAPTYTTIKTQILMPKCFKCHEAESENYGDLIDEWVKPGRPEKSGLYKYTRKGEMPPRRKAEPLSADEMKAIYDWILAGAPNN